MGGIPAGIEFVFDAETMRDVEKDVKVGAGLSRRRNGRINLGNAALGIGIGALLFTPDRGGKDEMRKVAGGRWMKAVLNDEELNVAKGVFEKLVVWKRDSGVRGDEPESLNASLDGGFDDVGIGEAARSGDAIDGNIPDAR
jgi:hypothetical protein